MLFLEILIVLGAIALLGNLMREVFRAMIGFVTFLANAIGWVVAIALIGYLVNRVFPFIR